MTEATSRWLAALEARHGADLTVSEIARALRALSSTYVERRQRLGRRGALDTAGKRAAYALYYGPLHFLTLDRIVGALQLDERPIRRLLDLGCGTGAAGAAWARRLRPPAAVLGIDAHPWALGEAAFTYAHFGLSNEVRRGNVASVRIPRSVDAVVAGWVVNELDEAARDALCERLRDCAARGVTVLIVEPVARRVSPWWDEWVDRFAPYGGRADQWRFQVELPDLLQRLGHAAGLRQEALTARSLLAGSHQARR